MIQKIQEEDRVQVLAEFQAQEDRYQEQGRYSEGSKALGEETLLRGPLQRSQ